MNKQLREVMTILTADKKKAAILGTLAFVAVGLWIRAALTTGPAHADAAQGDALNATSTSPKEARRSVGGSDDEAARPIVRVPPIKELSRDLFALSDALLPLSIQTDQDRPNDRKSALGIDDKSNRSHPESVAARKRRIEDEARQLYLRSTMTGSNPVAVLAHSADKHDGVVVRLGDEIDGFTLVAVGALKIEIEKEGIRVAITRDPS